MNKINPLYLLLFFALVALFMVYQTKHLESKTAIAIQHNTTLEKTGKRVHILKEQWKDDKASQKRIDSILNQHQFKRKVVKKEKKKGVLHVQLDALSAAELDKLINKFFNESVSLKKVRMIRNADKNVTVSLEFNL
ncbi:MAG: hypothetical protein DRG24_05285 [Epsilonproteobacteria bacterium]|nr:MAG: hypothetical protein DRG24_05285 [Campylobacterota bacterium]